MDELRHLEDVVINADLPVGERIASFAEQIGDPYHFMAYGTEVRLGFEGQISIEDAVARLLGVSDVPEFSEKPATALVADSGVDAGAVAADAGVVGAAVADADVADAAVSAAKSGESAA